METPNNKVAGIDESWPSKLQALLWSKDTEGFTEGLINETYSTSLLESQTITKEPRETISEAETRELEGHRKISKTKPSGVESVDKSRLKENANNRDDDGFTFAHIASFTGDTDSFAFLLDCGVNVDLQTCQTFFSLTPLHLAAFYGHSDICKLILAPRLSLPTYAAHAIALQRAVNRIRMPTANGDTALHYAAARGQMKVVEVFMATLFGFSNVRYAVKRARMRSQSQSQSQYQVKSVYSQEALHEEANDIIYEAITTENSDKDTPLHLSIRNGHHDIARFMMHATGGRDDILGGEDYETNKPIDANTSCPTTSRHEDELVNQHRVLLLEMGFVMSGALAPNSKRQDVLFKFSPAQHTKSMESQSDFGNLCINIPLENKTSPTLYGIAETEGETLQKHTEDIPIASEEEPCHSPSDYQSFSDCLSPSIYQSFKDIDFGFSSQLEPYIQPPSKPPDQNQSPSDFTEMKRLAQGLIVDENRPEVQLLIQPNEQQVEFSEFKVAAFQPGKWRRRLSHLLSPQAKQEFDNQLKMSPRMQVEPFIFPVAPSRKSDAIFQSEKEGFEKVPEQQSQSAPAEDVSPLMALVNDFSYSTTMNAPDIIFHDDSLWDLPEISDSSLTFEKQAVPVLIKKEWNETRPISTLTQELTNCSPIKPLATERGTHLISQVASHTWFHSDEDFKFPQLYHSECAGTTKSVDAGAIFTTYEDLQINKAIPIESGALQPDENSFAKEPDCKPKHMALVSSNFDSIRIPTTLKDVMSPGLSQLSLSRDKVPKEYPSQTSCLQFTEQSLFDYVYTPHQESFFAISASLYSQNSGGSNKPEVHTAKVKVHQETDSTPGQQNPPFDIPHCEQSRFQKFRVVQRRDSGDIITPSSLLSDYDDSIRLRKTPR